MAHYQKKKWRLFPYKAYFLKNRYILGLILSNLLGENYTEKDGYNMYGRSITAKFAYRF